nr:uncharacterized protein LOC115263348 [Aedes albopictus]
MSTVDQGCKACNRPSHVEDMVACDICGTWFHFTCAGVKASICDKPWRCGYCSSRASSVSGSKSSIRTSSSCAQMRLRQLEESKALDDRLMQQQAERERAYLAQKHQLEAEIETAKSICGSGRSARSLRSHRSHRSHVQLWINQSQETPEKQPDDCLAATTSTPIISSGNVVLEVPCRNDTVVHHQNAHQPMIPASPSVVPVVSAVTSDQCQQQPTMPRQKGILMNNPRYQHTAFQTVQDDMPHSSAAQQVTFHDAFGQHPPGQSTLRLQPTNQSEIQESAAFYQQPIVESSSRTNVQYEGPINAAARNAQRSSHQQVQRQSTSSMHYAASIPDISRRVSNPARTTWMAFCQFISSATSQSSSTC